MYFRTEIVILAKTFGYMDRRKFLKSVGFATAAVTLPGSALETLSGKPSRKDWTGLKVRFLGTGAADWNGKDARGEHRRLSSILLDGRILVDFTPSDRDMLPPGCEPKTVFYTHSHDDHYDAAAAIELGIETAYVGATWASRAAEEMEEVSNRLGRPAPAVIPISVGQRISVGDIALTALPANHATADLSEQTLIYLIEKQDVRLLYATDTGGIPVIAARLAGIDAHIPGQNGITALIMEATMGMDQKGDEDYRIFTHSSVNTVLRTVHVLESTGRYHPMKDQKVYLTHLARTLHGTQAELDATLPKPLAAAYDGLEVVFK